MKSVLTFEFDVDDWIKHRGYSELFDLKELIDTEIDYRQHPSKYINNKQKG